jgi:arylformamidase
LDDDYSPSTCVADINVYLQEYVQRSARARDSLPYRTFDYGAGELDFFPAVSAGAPLLVYVHGGYWQELSKDESAFPAIDLIPAGAAFAALGYGLAPRHSLDEIVAQVRTGLLWLLDNLAVLPKQPSCVHLTGMSAGAQLVAMALLDGWMPAGRHPSEVFASATLLSGVYDLDPLRHTYINDAVGMDAAAAGRNSPLGQLPDRLPRLVVARGANETPAFAWQQYQFVTAARGRADRLTELVDPERNHFDLPLDLGDRATPLGKAVYELMGL